MRYIPLALLYFLAMFVSLLSRTVNVKAVQLMEFIDKTISKDTTQKLRL